MSAVRSTFWGVVLLAFGAKGKPPEVMNVGTAWQRANIELVD